MQEMKMKINPFQYQSSCPSNPRISLTLDKAIEYELKHGRRLDCNMDRKRLRRTISNRLSAQRSRLKKAQYINDMEILVKDLEEMISVVRLQIKSYKEKRKLLLLQNDSLQKLIEIRSNESKLSETELEQKRIEVYNLKEVEKNVNKINNHEFNHGSQQQQMHQELMSIKRLSASTGQCPASINPANLCNNDLKHLQKLRLGIMIKLPAVEEILTSERTNQEEAANIDQYLNFEACTEYC